MTNILTDADDTILDYASPFLKYHNIPFPTERWEFIGGYLVSLGYDMETIHEMVVDFNHSPSFKTLEPYRNSQKVLKELHDNGTKIDIVTSCGTTDRIKQSRYDNLHEVFGNVIDNIHILPLSASKVGTFLKYIDKNYVLVEDTIGHYRDAKNLGISSFVINGSFNNADQHSDVKHFDTWDDFKGLFNKYNK